MNPLPVNNALSLLRLRSLLLFTALIAAMSLGTAARADSEVFELRGANPQEVLAAIRNLYGDDLRAQMIQQRLVVVGSAKQLDEVRQLIAQVDRLPAALRLTLSESPPVDEVAGFSIHTSAPMQTIDTTEEASIVIDKSRFGERAASAGWWVEVEQVPVEIDRLMLRVDPDGRGGLLISYSFVRYENGERRVYGNRVRGRAGDWLALLPTLTPPPAAKKGSKVYSSAQAGQRAQLYLKVEKIDAAR